jgi:hypothetical protein
MQLIRNMALRLNVETPVAVHMRYVAKVSVQIRYPVTWTKLDTGAEMTQCHRTKTTKG